jgi:hypothetical protein
VKITWALLFAFCALSPVARAAEGSNGDVRWNCGGIGADERRALEARRSTATLELLFVSQKRGAYLAGAQVTISRNGASLASFEAEGPICLLDLPSGAYRIQASLRDFTATTTVRVPATGRAPLATLRFPDEPSNGIEASEEEKRQAREP